MNDHATKPPRHTITIWFCDECADRLNEQRQRVGPDGHGWDYCAHLGVFALLTAAEGVLYKPCSSREKAELFAAASTGVRARVDVAMEVAAAQPAKH